MDEVRQYEQLFKGRRIMFLMPSLDTGGAERVMITLLKYLDREKFQPILVVLNEGINPLDLEDIGCNVDMSILHVSRVRKAAFKVREKVIDWKPDTVLFTLGYMNEMMATIIPFLPKKVRYIARESSIPSLRNRADKLSRIHEYIYSNWMARFDYIICQSEEMRIDMEGHYPKTTSKLQVIQNPIDKEYILRKSQEPCEAMKNEFHNILAVGSLKRVKNYDLLIGEASQAEENARYYILGDGPERNHLEQMIISRNLENKVFLLGHQNNPWKYMARADEFWQKSHWEGSSNALREWTHLKLKKP
ncbi:MAG: glycosyltransferase [Flavobacteriales bacterium]|nr:glycosyltransferase [Flavobacteriales bacterium]